MLRYVVRRLLVSAPVLVTSSIIVFLLVKLTGDPLEYLKERSPAPPQHVIDMEAHRLYLDRPWPAQYWNWIANLVQGRWGPPVQGTGDVGGRLLQAFSVSARLVLPAIMIFLAIAVLIGVMGAVRQYGFLDHVSAAIGVFFLSVPAFWFAVVLKQGGIWWNDHIRQGTFYTIGDRSVLIEESSLWARSADLAGHAVLPVLVLGLTSYASWSRFTRASVLEALASEYVKLARAKGLSPRRVLLQHGLRTALIPLTSVTALDTATLLSGAVVIESVFQWRGMGDLFLTALKNADFNIMLGWLMITAAIVILTNLVTDVLYGVLDPRVR